MRPPIVTKFAGVNVAASVVASLPVNRPSKAVAKDPHPPVRPTPPAGRMFAAIVPAAKMELHIIDDDELERREEGRFLTWLEAQFNPNELQETIGTVWNDIAIPGLSHQRRHYSYTKSVPFKFTLQFDAREYMQTADVDPFESPGISAGAEYVERAINFLRSLGYASVQSGSPPRILFYWPSFISVTATLEEMDIRYTGWAPTGEVLRFSATVALKEIRDVHMSRTDVLVAGNQRTTPGRIG